MLRAAYARQGAGGHALRVAASHRPIGMATNRVDLPARPALANGRYLRSRAVHGAIPKGPFLGRFRLTDRQIGEVSRARFSPLVGRMGPHAGHSPVSVRDEAAFGLVEDDQYVAERIADAGAAANGNVEGALDSLAAGVEE
jgi:hypothetical protein